MSRLILCAFLAAVVVSGTAQAQGMSGHDHSKMAPSSAGGLSSEAYKAAHDKMMRDMGAALTGDADRDFVQGMIPHHQGAIDMAEVQLKYGKDPAIKKLARDIIAAQKKEIAFMRKWLAAHPH